VKPCDLQVVLSVPYLLAMLLLLVCTVCEYAYCLWATQLFKCVSFTIHERTFLKLHVKCMLFCFHFQWYVFALVGWLVGWLLLVGWLVGWLVVVIVVVVVVVVVVYSWNEAYLCVICCWECCFWSWSFKCDTITRI